MASGRDVRDMLGLSAGGDAPTVAPGAAVATAPSVTAAALRRAKPPVGGAGRKIQGVAREVAALYGERPPPVAVYEENKAYRAKRQSTAPAKKWIQQPFTNPARHDGLVLRHWRRKPIAASASAPVDASAPIEPCAEYVKYAVHVDMPTFTDAEYDAHLRSDDWSRDETDYLFRVVHDYSYRWAVIWDRYDYAPPNSTTDAPTDALALAKPRSLEDLKARFYHISAKLMKLRIPEVDMDGDQYTTYEMLTKFDPVMERNRKMLATALINRTMDEVKEEEFLLTELQRINMAANRLDAEREELRARLDAPTANTTVSAGLQAFTSSQSLQALFQQLFQQDRSKKRAAGGGANSTGPSRLSLSANDMVHTPGSAQQQLSAANRRTSMAHHAHSQSVAQTPVKQLSSHQERRFNVSTHDRLTSGVTFGSDKLLKMRQAKSNVQTQKIAAMLATLGVSELISIPTSRVADVFESLVGKVGKLLDVRKVREKEEGECRVLSAMKERRAVGGADGHSENQSKRETGAAKPEGDMNTDGGNEEDDEDDVDKHYEDTEGGGEGEVEDEPSVAGDDGGFDGRQEDEEDEEDDDMDVDVDAEGEDESSKQQSRATSTTARPGHKRSASVLSAVSGSGSGSGSGSLSKKVRK